MIENMMENSPKQISISCNRCGKPVSGAAVDTDSFAPAIRPFVRYISKRVKCNDCEAQEEKRRAQAEIEQRKRQLEAIRAVPSVFLAKCGVPTLWRHASLDSCPDLPAELLKDVRSWADTPSGTIYLHGIPGSGKTCVAVSLLRHILTTGRLLPSQCRYASEAGYLDALKRSYEEGQMERSPKTLPRNDPRRVRLLILDDLASTRLTDWGKGEMANLIEARHANGLLTIITSNIGLDSLADAIDQRITSRIAQYKNVLAFPDKDLRVEGSS